jgi:hypothetical protein
MGLPDESDISFLKHAEGEDDLSGEDIVFDWPTSKQEPRLNWRWLALCMVLLVSTNTITLFLVKFSRDSHLDQICALHTSQNWSKISIVAPIMAICIDNIQAPILQDAQITYTPTRFNGSLFHETIYRKEASPDVDLAWRALGVDCRHLNFISGLLIFPSRD